MLAEGRGGLASMLVAAGFLRVRVVLGEGIHHVFLHTVGAGGFFIVAVNILG